MPPPEPLAPSRLSGAAAIAPGWPSLLSCVALLFTRPRVFLVVYHPPSLALPAAPLPFSPTSSSNLLSECDAQ